MNEIDLILTLTAALTAALALGFLALRLKLPPIVGYLLAGLLIGPHTPGFVANRHLAEQLAEIGVILLMFGVGLHFHLEDLLAVKRIAVVGAVCQIAVASGIGTLLARAFGWPWSAGVVFGIALSVASTVVLLRVLGDNRELQTRTGRIAIGWLVVQDVFAVFVLVLLPAVFGKGAARSTNLPAALAIAALKLAALAALTLWPGARLIPRLLAAAARTRSRELFTLTVLVIALGLAVGSAKVFGVSMALGAFLAGMVVGQTEFSFRAASEALPMRDAFAVLFFVSVGMLFDPQHLVRAPALTAATAGVVMLGTPVSALAIVILLGYGARVGLRVAGALAQIGEFSFMIARLGDQLGVLPAGATDSLVAASIVSITLNPLLYRVVQRIERVLVRRAATGPPEAPPPDAGEAQAIVVGYGPVGETVVRLLRDQGIVPTVIELNIDTARRLRGEGIRAVYGDASRPEVLKQAGAERAIALILSAPGSEDASEIVRAAREINPGIQVLARAAFSSQADALRAAGAEQVFSGEAEVARAMSDAIRQRLGGARAGLYGLGQ